MRPTSFVLVTKTHLEKFNDSTKFLACDISLSPCFPPFLTIFRFSTLLCFVPHNMPEIVDLPLSDLNTIHGDLVA
ncbi:hypothetical protein Y032_0022g513 [Ancylostoma ceylanicum]|uniref:Uncharacterized protein n=1 Tax=Ancylostoma ceylanicum TaxID=53326 RepID=A0A016UZJ2_9BILA|nr:hypothetical protein Y032_0022g513 [Ancylostoma ceylanicum]